MTKMIHFCDSFKMKEFVVELQDNEESVKKGIAPFLKYIPFHQQNSLQYYLPPAFGVLVRFNNTTSKNQIQDNNFLCFVTTRVTKTDLERAWKLYYNLETNHRLSNPQQQVNDPPKKPLWKVVKKIVAQIAIALLSYMTVKYVIKIYKKIKNNPDFLRALAGTTAVADPSMLAAGRLLTRMDQHIQKAQQQKRGRGKKYSSIYRR